ncbi:hypothetical protein EW146_g7141 [Bondarzewia mesenterica]|uniref:Uncharacterized protein n=1 Tax=Bondarzewia mesenterica TaxID=1095465 RepID=A0A4S4LLM8_9AGAM|nr:hypothetical protein EW146_g7141 [Bondarzewia mesenterica]
MPATKSGISNSVKVSILGSSRSAVVRASRVASKQSVVLKNTDIICAREKGQRKSSHHLSGLGVEAWHIFAELRGDGEDHVDTLMQGIEEEMEGDDMHWETLLDELKEDEAFLTTVRDIIGSQWKPHWYKDSRSWRLRLQ